MLLTGFCLGCIAALFLNVLRDFRHILIAQVFLGLLIAASAFLLNDFLPENIQWITGDIMTTLPALFWLLCILGFSESPNLRTPFTGIALISFLVPALARPFGAEGTSNELLHLFAWLVPQSFEYILILHGMWAVYSGWKGDLVETRRRIRGYILVAVGITALCVTSSLNLGFGDELPIVASALCCIACVYMMLSTKKGILLEYSTPRSVATDERSAGAASFVRLVPKPAEMSEQDLLAEKLNILMAEGYYRCERLTLRRLAQKLNTPEHKLRALINTRFKYRNFSDYINTLRIDEACKRLLEEDKAPIQNIALDAGYRTMSSFNRAFRDIRSCTPTEYRISGNDLSPGSGISARLSRVFVSKR